MRAPCLNHRVQRFSLGWACCVAALLGIAGCGADLYQQRIDATRAMFAHQEQLNQNLQGAWGDQEVGISLRVPTQFLLMPPPVKPAAGAAADKGKPGSDKGTSGDKGDTKSGSDEDIIDDRQPTYMNIGLPGLRGAFRAPLKAAGDKNSAIEGEGFIYVLTNHHLADQPEQAGDFKKNVAQILGDALHKSIDKNDWRENDRFPPEAKAKQSFVKSLSYDTLILNSEEPIAGYYREFTAYMYTQGSIQVVVLTVFPKDVEPSEKLNDRLPLCLETLTVSGDKLLLPSTGGVQSSNSPTF
ncbi:MAG: hypothetical protein JSS02_35495 [Planctomycetes bacterium]|nr:hypothetical protein [Planctomycetota bacterium]